VSGVDPRTGAGFVNQVFLGFTGGAARAGNDAWLTTAHVGNGGMCFQDSIELAELYQPILVQERSLIADTEGAGQWRGAHSVRVEFGPIGAPIDVGYVSDGTDNAPKGVRGGLQGSGARQHMRRRDGTLEKLPACAMIRVEPGETIVSVSCGGGGYGAPTARDRDRVRKDVEEGWVSASRAREIYGYGG
ncbi:MAG: Hydantoinase B/oxoprolinase, partial [Rhodospirillales bacterium]|nr:Hydantoinase B/oxoprolinase [Rhodospirillales bacterium]